MISKNSLLRININYNAGSMETGIENHKCLPKFFILIFYIISLFDNILPKRLVTKINS